MGTYWQFRLRRFLSSFLISVKEIQSLTTRKTKKLEFRPLMYSIYSQLYITKLAFFGIRVIIGSRILPAIMH